jgi:hypothetical protein
VPKKVVLEDMSMTKRVNDSEQREPSISSDTRERGEVASGATSGTPAASVEGIEALIREEYGKS